jgi:hypothetical protein
MKKMANYFTVVRITFNRQVLKQEKFSLNKENEIQEVNVNINGQ